MGPERFDNTRCTTFKRRINHRIEALTWPMGALPERTPRQSPLGTLAVPRTMETRRAPLDPQKGGKSRFIYFFKKLLPVCLMAPMSRKEWLLEFVHFWMSVGTHSKIPSFKFENSEFFFASECKEGLDLKLLNGFRRGYRCARQCQRLQMTPGERPALRLINSRALPSVQRRNHQGVDSLD